MTALAHDGNVVWYWAPTVASVSAPSAADIAAATRIPDITNYDTPSSEAEVDTSGIDDLYDTSVVGTAKAGPIVLTIKRDDLDETDTWDLFTFRDVGYLIKSKDGVATVASKVEVYPAQVGQKRPDGYSRNATQKFMVSFYVTSPPDLDAVIAA